MAVVHDFEPKKPSPKAAAGGSGGPPMELLERVIKIESALPNLANKSDVETMRNDMSHLAGKSEVEALRIAVNNCATKADLQELRADFHRELNLQTWRMVGFSVTINMALVAATYFIATNFGR